MEVLSAAASGMAVASLSIQLLQTVGTIKTFLRNVKGASKEIERLVTLIDRLNALLENIRDVMERQTSLHNQHFPAPSQMVFEALRICQKSLEPLTSVIQKQKKGHTGTVSAVTRLKDEIKFGFKTKEIAEFEVRIQREIDCLHAALNVNSTSILTTVLPALLQNQQTCINSWSLITQKSAPNHGTRVIKQSETAQKGLSTLKLRIWNSWWSGWLGVHHRCSVYYFPLGKKETQNLSSKERYDVSESHELLLVWAFAKVGIYWTRQNPRSYISWSLGVFPIVNSLFEYFPLFQMASITEIQQKFASGLLHPYTQDVDGLSLLHFAAMFGRADIAHLLIQYGLRSSFARQMVSPLLLSFTSSNLDRGYYSGQLDTIRLLMRSSDVVDDFESTRSWIGRYPDCYRMSLETLEWIWINASDILDHNELLGLRSSLFEHLVSRYRTNLETYDKITDYAVRLVSSDLLQHYFKGEIRLLHALFGFNTSSLDSIHIGNAFIDLAERLGLDIETCANAEREVFRDNISYSGTPSRRVVLERSESRGWTLRLDWIHDSSAPGYLLAVEHIGLGADTSYSFEWPFSGHFDVVKHTSYDQRKNGVHHRFHRRMLNKDRKERARTGQKRAKSRMPGAWF